MLAIAVGRHSRCCLPLSASLRALRSLKSLRSLFEQAPIYLHQSLSDLGVARAIARMGEESFRRMVVFLSFT